MDYSSKVVVITGGGAGIGRAAAEAFAARGAAIAVNSLSQSGQAVCQAIRAQGGKAVFVRADVSAAQGAQMLITETVKAFGGVDVLVNAAGIVTNGSIEECSEEDWDRAMAVNVKSVYLTCKAAMAYLKERKGTIVNITSTVAIKGVVNRAAYSATKGAVLALSRSMAAQYVKDGVRVNCVCPGTVISPSFQRRVASAADPEQAMRDFVARQPMGRLGTAEEIARAILFAADPQVSFMTGANIVVDGAMTV